MSLQNNEFIYEKLKVKNKARAAGGTFFQKLIKNKVLLLMLAPAVLHVLIFAYLPMFGVILAFKRFQYQSGILGSPWVGLDNFRFFFASGDAFIVTRNTLLYNLAFIIFIPMIQILLAIMLSEAGKLFFKKIAQSTMFLPFFISWVIVGSIAYNLFNYEYGLFNHALTALGFDPLNVYSHTGAWKYILFAFKLWKELGYGMVIYLAAIISIDSEMYDAAKIDGANIFQRISYITLPSIFPVIVLLFLLSVGQIFRGDFGLFYQLIGNNGNLYQQTDIIDTFVFRALLNSSDIGMAAAAGFYQSIMCFFTILLINYLVKRMNKDYALF
ncbi:ABC transporter permease [Paenibacillus sepulcri]|uniref:ABC transporter permease subunit n=1 Tax=Paenibacillus sepulcri TaxID=359917 RepID=A0ABS7BXB9_9BACL|nr:ABC transporter permease subunit [Paenibacillus sepulcri]